MQLYAGLDVSMDETSICIVDRDGKIIKECKAATEPAAIRFALDGFADRLHRIGLEAQSFSPWLYAELRAFGLPAIVVEAVHMQKALSAQRNKTDRNDARGIAHMMRFGWFRQVHVKSSESQHLRVLLSNRRLLKRKFIDVENEIRGTLKAFGIKIGDVSRGKFEARTLDVIEAAQPALQDLVRGMLGVRRMLWTEFTRLHNMLIRIVRRDAVCRRFMTVPGVGPVTALAFKTSVDDPRRFRRSRTVGAHFGLTPKRFQSGSIDYDGGITRCGDPEVRTTLYEAANGLMVRCKKWSALRAWGMGIAKRRGHKRAIVAVARKLAIVLHRMWLDGTEFRWTRADGSHGGRVPAIAVKA
jgi:transposase